MRSDVDHPKNPHDTMIGLSTPTLHRLRAAANRALGDSAFMELREAGYDGGAPVYRAFLEWAAGEGAESVSELELAEFSELLEKFFAAAGWGNVRLRPMADVYAVVEIEDCWEAKDSRRSEAPACFITTGALTGFLEQIAGFPMAAMEYRCQSCGDEKCEFIVGNAEAVHFAYEQIAAGQRIEDITSAQA
jgi:predicted hydrocarbon binding protein